MNSSKCSNHRHFRHVITLLFFPFLLLHIHAVIAVDPLPPAYDNPNAKDPDNYLRPMPTRAQQMYADHEVAAMITFNMGTYYGNGDPTCNRDNWLGLHGSGKAASFNPYMLDTDQWARIMQQMGVKHAVLTVKHGCGFLLWPTQVPIHTSNGSTVEYTYSVGRPDQHSFPYDVVQNFVNSMHKYGLGVGFYYSIKNNFYTNILMHDYQYNETDLLPGQIHMTLEDYETMALGHLRELWTNYGNLTEIWFDGGYANTTQAKLQAMLQELQPDAIVWRGQGITPNTVAWVGTEYGFPVGDDIWSTGCAGGNPGHPEGPIWCPKGCDTTLQVKDMWFYIQEDPVRNLTTLVDVYHKTVGRNGVMELNFAPDKTGRITYDHEQRYQQLGDYLTTCYGQPSVTWTNKTGFIVEVHVPSVLTDRILLREDQWQGGQRVRHYKVYVQETGQHDWILFSKGHSIGNKRIDLGKLAYLVTRLRIHVEAASGTPMFREISLFAPCPDPDNFTSMSAMNVATTVS